MLHKKRILAAMLGVIVACTSIPGQPVMLKAEESDSLEAPDYFWDFEEVDGQSIVNQGTVTNANAVLKGNAKIAAEDVVLGDTTYSVLDNHVLVLAGGNKGTSYVDLPSNLYGGVTEQTGLTWSFWMKPDTSVSSYSRLFSSTDSSNKNEFAYTPYAKDGYWNVVFDDTNKYYQAYVNEPAKNKWNLITVTVNADKIIMYVNGEKVSTTSKGGSSADLAARLSSIASFTKHALGRTYSTWSDPDCKVTLDDVSVYKRALTAEEVAKLAIEYGFDVKPPRGVLDAVEGIY